MSPKLSKKGQQEQKAIEQRTLAHVAQKIEQCLQKQQITSADVSRAIGSSKMTLRRVLSGEYNPSIGLLSRIADALGEPLESLLAAERPAREKTKKKQAKR